MTDITASDWDALQNLAGRVGLSAERVGSLRRRLETSAARPGSPYVLLAGRPGAGIELLLGRWLAPEAAEELDKAGGRPLVIGPRPGDVRPRLGAWPGWKSAKVGSGHLIALRPAGPPAADVLAQLASLGYLEQAVLVTRLSQALNAEETELARSLAALAATARLLVVGLPGEEPGEGELAEVSAYAVSRMRQAGFGEGRCLSARVWFTGGPPRPGALSDVAPFLAADPAEVAAGRVGMTREALAGLFEELRKRAETAPAVSQPAIPDTDCERLSRELTGYLADLGRELDRQAEKRGPLSADVLRRYALDALRGWGAYSGIEGSWMKYVERVRPGTQAAFLTEAASAVALLDYEPGQAPPGGQDQPPAARAAPPERVMVEAKRLAFGLVCGVAGYLLVATLLSVWLRATGAAQATALPGPVVTLLCAAALVLGLVLGYGAARGIFRRPGAPPQPAAAPPSPAAVYGWPQVERRLTAWFSEHLRARPATPAEERRALARRFGIEEHQA